MAKMDKFVSFDEIQKKKSFLVSHGKNFVPKSNQFQIKIIGIVHFQPTVT